MNTNALGRLLQAVTTGGIDEVVEAVTPHGNYRFDISAVEWDAEREVVVLRLEPLQPVMPASNEAPR